MCFVINYEITLFSAFCHLYMNYTGTSNLPSVIKKEYAIPSSSSSSVVIYTQRLKTTVTRCWRLDQTNTSSTSGRKF